MFDNTMFDNTMFDNTMFDNTMFDNTIFVNVTVPNNVTVIISRIYLGFNNMPSFLLIKWRISPWLPKSKKVIGNSIR
jgi:hypothetical protein